MERIGSVAWIKIAARKRYFAEGAQALELRGFVH